MTNLDLGVIGRRAVASVISPLGRHVWFGFPRLDAAAVATTRPGGRSPDTDDLDAAPGLFDHIPARRNHLDLQSEDIPATPGSPRDNVPQTCSCSGLVPAATCLSRSWEAGLCHA